MEEVQEERGMVLDNGKILLVEWALGERRSSVGSR